MSPQDRLRLRLWGLSRTDLGAMFGISRQAVSKWLTHGVPPERAVVVADVDVIPERLPNRHEWFRICEASWDDPLDPTFAQLRGARSRAHLITRHPFTAWFWG